MSDPLRADEKEARIARFHEARASVPALTDTPNADICGYGFCHHQRSAHKRSDDRTDYGRGTVGHCSSCCDPESDNSDDCDHDFDEPTRVPSDLGHDDEIGAAFEEYDRLVRWEEHDSRLDATDPVYERAAARGRIVALIANLAYEIAAPSTAPVTRGHDMEEEQGAIE